jgi:hypothetical protein
MSRIAIVILIYHHHKETLLMEVLCHYPCRWTDENHENLSQDAQCLQHYPNREHPNEITGCSSYSSLLVMQCPVGGYLNCELVAGEV